MAGSMLRTILKMPRQLREGAYRRFSAALDCGFRLGSDGGHFNVVQFHVAIMYHVSSALQQTDHMLHYTLP